MSIRQILSITLAISVAICVVDQQVLSESIGRGSGQSVDRTGWLGAFAKMSIFVDPIDNA